MTSLISRPRISFSVDFLDDDRKETKPSARPITNEDHSFEFLSGIPTIMSDADELFREGRLLPFRPPERLERVAVKSNDNGGRQTSWFIDDVPSPRPPTCDALWKELLRLRKKRASTLSPSSSSSGVSGDERKKVVGNKEKIVNRVKRGIRIRPVVNVPICTHGKTSS